jgi:hypothetical protein
VVSVQADLIGPPPILVVPRAVKVTVEVDENAKDARLVIPQNLLAPAQPRLRGALDRVPMIVAGLALTCAFVSGGFWLVRRGKAGTKTISALLLSWLVITGSVVWANEAPPPQPKKPEPLKLPANVKITGKIIFEVVAQKGDSVKLIVNKDMIVKDGKAEKAPEEKPGN